MCKRPRCMQVSYPLTHRGHVVALAHCPFRSLLPPRLKNSLSFRLDVMHMTVLNGVLESSTLVQITGRDNPETQQTQTPILNVARINTDRGNPEHSKRPASFAPGQHRCQPQNANVLCHKILNWKIFVLGGHQYPGNLTLIIGHASFCPDTQTLE